MHLFVDILKLVFKLTPFLFSLFERTAFRELEVKSSKMSDSSSI